MTYCETCGRNIVEEGIGWDGHWWCSIACSRQDRLFEIEVTA